MSRANCTHSVKALASYCKAGEYETTTAPTSAEEHNMSHSQNELPNHIDIKQCIPKHCFAIDDKKSYYYLLRTLIQIALLATLANVFLWDASFGVQLAFWPVYIFIQGTLFFLLFLLGHDSGHRSFCANNKPNHLVGILVHSIILLPYESWKQTHRNHHRNCGHFSNDEGFGPVEQGAKVNKKLSALIALVGIAYWCYLIGISRHGTNHFSPNDKALKRYRSKVVNSLAAVIAVVCVLAISGYFFGFLKVFVLYFLPLQVYTYYFMIVTFLQHNDGELLWYGDPEWSYMKGSLTTIDRNYGMLSGALMNVGFHQIHHLFPAVPHYNLPVATSFFRKHFPALINHSDEFPLRAYSKNLRNYVEYGDVPKGQSSFSYAQARQKIDTK